MRRHLEKHRTGSAGWLRAAVLGADDGILSTASLMLVGSFVGRHRAGRSRARANRTQNQRRGRASGAGGDLRRSRPEASPGKTSRRSVDGPQRTRSSRSRRARDHGDPESASNPGGDSVGAQLFRGCGGAPHCGGHCSSAGRHHSCVGDVSHMPGGSGGAGGAHGWGERGDRDNARRFVGRPCHGGNGGGGSVVRYDRLSAQTLIRSDPSRKDRTSAGSRLLRTSAVSRALSEPEVSSTRPADAGGAKQAKRSCGS
jgi:hypothetical protein